VLRFLVTRPICSCKHEMNFNGLTMSEISDGTY
jgi:hypothetical protein